MTRRFLLSCLALSLSLVGWARPKRSGGDEQQPTLNELLRSRLKCRRPEDFAFVNLVTAKVDAGELPRGLVLNMMQWACKRAAQEADTGRRRSDIPFPYFQEGLRLRAAELGVSLPAFSP
jgi:hypothetical protein